MSGPASLLEPLLRSLPLWLIGLILITACVLAREAGLWLRRRADRRSPESNAHPSDGANHIVSAIFALLAFLIGLTFSIALDHFNSRRALVVEEANAISNVYQRAGLFDEPDQTRLQTLLREYARSRIAPDGLWGAAMDARLSEARNQRAQLWYAAREAIYPVRETELASYFVDAMNEASNVGVRREIAGHGHIPTRIIGVLLLYLLAASAALGYTLGPDNRGRRLASTCLVVLFSVAIVLILDIDRPRTGTVTVPQVALQELVTALEFDAQRPPDAASSD
jgi:hypothetical protein